MSWSGKRFVIAEIGDEIERLVEQARPGGVSANEDLNRERDGHAGGDEPE